MPKTIVVGVLESVSEAQRAVHDLVQSGVPSQSIAFAANEQRHASMLSGAARLAADAASTAVNAGVGIAAAAGGLATSLLKLGMPKEQVQSYSDALGRGGVVITVDAARPAQADMAADVLRRHGAVEVQESVYAPVYSGPERRVNSTPWLAQERRRAA